VAWLEQEKKIGRDLPIRDWKKGRSLERLGILGFTAAAADFFGWPGAGDFMRRLQTAQDTRLLDGVLAVWQGAVVN
jgi:protease-4